MDWLRLFQVLIGIRLFWLEDQFNKVSVKIRWPILTPEG